MTHLSEPHNWAEPHHWKEEPHAGEVGERFYRHARSPLHLGLLNAPHGRASAVGSCGDKVEISVCLAGDIIAEIGHLPQGCVYTVACASAVSVLALGKSLDEALTIQPEDVERELGGLPEDHRHCARLAVNTLGEAVAEAYRTFSAAKYREE